MTTTNEPRAKATEEFCYLTTIGRVSGKPHEIEIWFAFDPAPGSRTLYMLAGGRDRADWVRNLRQNPVVAIRLADATWPATAQIVAPDDADDPLARELLCGKYQGWQPGQPLSEWGRTALPVRFTL